MFDDATHRGGAFRARARLLFCALLCPIPTHALEPLGAGTQGFPYRHPVDMVDLQMEGTSVRVAYFDVSADPGRANGHAALLLHGRNFFGAYWADTIASLHEAGYRVIVSDRIGFGPSSKPDVPRGSHLHAQNVRALLAALSITKTNVVGHCVGGMIAVRSAFTFPQAVDKPVPEGPIGLEDYRNLVPYAPRQTLMREHLDTGADAFDGMFRGFFAQRPSRFQVFSDVRQGWLHGAQTDRIARTAAHT
jgi:pimeloyl-ACP methyl ester carboxylesterase